LGLSGRVPRRVDAVTKTALLDLIDQAVKDGWEHRAACRLLELPESRAWRWRRRRRVDRLDDLRPGGKPLHGLLPDEEAAVVALFEEWGETDRSHRKLAHRGSYLGRVWVSPSSVKRVLAAQGLHLRRPRRAGTSKRSPFPGWVTYTRNCIWIYDTTHFPGCPKTSVTAVMDLVTRKWINEIVSAEETSSQIQVVFTEALELEGLLPLVEARQDGLVDLAVDDPSRPILLAVSDNGPQMTSGSTREFMALCAIAQHFGRPATPTDQAWIETLFGHIKGEWPHLERISDPAVLRAELVLVRVAYNTVRLSHGVPVVWRDVA
jgi:transposase InsO family protein